MIPFNYTKMKHLKYLLPAICILMASCESSDIRFTYSDVSKDVNYTDGGANGSGTGGSMARFTIKGNYLYTVDTRTLKTFDIANPESGMTLKSTWTGGWGNVIETIFPYGDKLFLGTTAGMYIVDITQPANPSYYSYYQHIVSCDPVVVQGNYAYVTLHTENNAWGWCNRGVSELQVIDISDLKNPVKVKSYPMSQPYGLGIDGNLLFVCDAGLKVFNLKTPVILEQINHFTNPGKTYDVIPYNDVLILIGENGLRQYSYENDAVTLLSEINTITN